MLKNLLGREVEMASNRNIKFLMAFMLVFALFAGGFGQKAEAAVDNAASVMAVYADGTVLVNEAVSLGEETKTAMEALIKATEGQVDLSDTEWGKSLDAIKGSEILNEHFWAFYVNGKFSSKGSETFELHPGDKVTFHYVDWNVTTPDEYEPPVEHAKPVVQKPLTKDQVKEALDKAITYSKKDGVSDWETVVMKQAGTDIPADKLENLKKIVKDNNGSFKKITDTERYSIAILAAGGNPTNVEGYNLIESIYNGNVTSQGLNAVAYALLALDAGGFEVPADALWTREKLLGYLKENQKSDGGWNWNVKKEISDMDTTGMVLTSLAPYINDKTISSVIEKALNYLKGEFNAGKINNSSTAAQVVITLSALGIDARSKEFTNENGSLIEYLLSYQNADGGFYYQGAASDSDPFSTEQGLLGLAAYQLFLNGKGSLYQLGSSPAPETPKPEEPVKQPAPVEQPSQPAPDKQPAAPADNAEAENKGHRLPDTATDSYTLIVLGLIAAAGGGTIYAIRRKQQA
ncbi:DUF4430 domain-containing protein [Bacillus sp. B-jedd]|uniref:DUF4430 domain-containing protein n=1 Tax=Bacillus sp. B-jedd TaxID=1476857 RepID=UPI0005156981|nr:DUF4430 domain-containing protein [Bacillus sp. B-jedd]CEG28350.1 cell wall anchor domain-containing protein [Bacillus sp. B-jedd]